MRKSGGFFFAIAAIIMAVVIWGNPLSPIMAMFAPPEPIEPSAVAISTVDLGVDEAQLMATVRDFSQPRSTPTEKETARQYITERLASYGITIQQQRYGKFLLPDEPSEDAVVTDINEGINLIAEIPGSDPTAGSILLGAHYDTVSGSAGCR